MSSCGSDAARVDAYQDGASATTTLRLDKMAGHFGSVMTGTTSPSLTFNATNTGTATSGAMVAVLSGADASSFAVTTTCTTLAPSASCAIAVAFTPATAGSKSASLSVSVAGSVVSATLDGTGVTGGALTLTASTNALGSVLVGDTGTTMATFTVTNTSTSASGVIAVQAAGSDPADFAKSADLCAGHALASGATCSFSVSLTPHSRGAKSASFDVIASPDGMLSAAVNGVGLAPALLIALPDLLDFGSVVTGQLGQLSLAIVNLGDVATGTVAQAITGAGAASYSVVAGTCDAHALAAQATCTVAIRFAPTATGIQRAQIGFTGAPGGTSATILNGDGIPANGLVISPPSAQYTGTKVGQIGSTLTFAISNHATTASGTLNTSLGGATASQFQVASDTCQGNSLAAGAQCTIDVAFAPITRGAASAQLLVTSQLLGVVTAGLAGSALAPPTLTALPTVKHFGSVPTGGQSASQSFTVTNTGDEPTGTPAIASSGANPGQFTIVASDCTASLAPAASCIVQVRFAPTALGVATATLAISATPGNVIDADLDGTGSDPAGIAITPSSFTFPVTSVGDSAMVQTFTLTNLGTTATGTLAIASSSAELAQTTTCTSLPAGASCAITVTFTPSAIGARTATITATGAPGGTATLGLAGDGRPRLEILALDGAAPTNPYDLGTQIAGFGTADVLITLRNNTANTTPLTVAEVYSSPAQFATLDNTCGSSIAPANPCTVRVRFAPTSVGIKTGSTTFSIGATVNDRALANLTGVGSALHDHPPTSIDLSPASVTENKPSGTTVGTLTSNDPDPGDSFTYSLVTGAGATDNAQFAISGNNVVAAASFDFETKPTYSIRVRSTDSGFQTFEQPLAITITDANDAPTAVALAPSSIQENQPVGVTVGALTTTDQDANEAFTYTLVVGGGGADNASFAISGNSLVATAAFDFETKASYAIRVRTTDHAGAMFEQPLTIAIANANEQPTALALSDSSVAENQPTGTTVGTLAATDPDTGDAFTFALVPGVGSADNTSFTISGNALRTADVFDFETRNAYSIRVAVVDRDGLSFERQLAIAITDANDAPTALNLVGGTIRENQPIGSTAGAFTTTDQDVAGSFTYALVAGAGATDNGAFTISGATLRSAQSFDFEAKNTYAIRVRTTDSGGLFVENQFTIFIIDVAEGPGDIALSPATIAESSGATDPNDIVGLLTATSPTPGATFTFTLIPGVGATDNALFNIAGANLRETASLNFEDAHGPTYSVRIRVTDQLALFTEKAFTITVTDVNERPIVTATASTLAYAENAAATTVDPGVTVTDPDTAGTGNNTIASAAVMIASGCTSPEDVLAGPSLPPGITASYNASTCTLTLTGAAMPSMYQTALRAVTYVNVQDNPSTVTRTVSFTATDSGTPGAQTSVAATRDIAVTALNDAPIVTISAGAITFTEAGGPASPISAANEVANLATFTTAAASAIGVGDQVVVAGVTVAGYDGTWTVASIDTTTHSFTAMLPTSGLAGSSGGTATISEVAIDAGATVTDLDNANLASASISITTGCTTSEDVLAVGAPGALVVGGSACTVTLLGAQPLAVYEAAFRSVTYQNTNLDNPSTAARTVTFSANDGTTDSAPVTRTITVVAVNDAPTISAPASASPIEDTAFAFTAANAISIADVDVASGMVTVTLAVSNGKLIATGAGVSGSTTASVTITNTLANVNAALGTLTYTGDADFAGSDTLSITANDNGNTGAGGAQSSATTTAITVTAVNDAPVLAGGGASPSYTENDVATVLTIAITVSDVDSTNLTGATIQITTSCDPNTDVLAFATIGSISQLSYDAASCKLTVTGSDTVAHYQAALATVTYSSSSDDPSTLSRTVTWQVDDGSASNNLSNTVTTSVSVTAVNDAPVNTVPGLQTTLEDSAITLSIANSNAISVADVDAGSATMTTSLLAMNGLLAVGTPAGGARSCTDCVNPVLTGTIAAITDALGAGLAFSPAANFNGTGVITITTTDGTQSDVDTVMITVTAVNDASSFTKGPNQTIASTVVGAQTVNPWATAISAGPPDESGQVLTFQITANDNPGLFSASPAVSPAGVLTYTPSGMSGTANITISLKDDGGTTNGGVDASAGQTFQITVTGPDQFNTSGTTTGTGFGTPAWTGQTFTAGVSGQLVRADIQVFCNGCGTSAVDLILSVRATSSGLPTGADLATQMIPGDSSGSTVVKTFTFASPAPLSAGTQYALILRPATTPPGSGYFWIRSSPSTYANGSRVLSPNSGSTWSADSTRDYNFKTYMQ